MSEHNRIPQHIAIIMDGNGRWAEKHGKERYEGHAAGLEPVRTSLRSCVKWGVKYLTLYTFSTSILAQPCAQHRTTVPLLRKSPPDPLLHSVVQRPKSFLLRRTRCEP